MDFSKLDVAVNTKYYFLKCYLPHRRLIYNANIDHACCHFITKYLLDYGYESRRIYYRYFHNNNLNILSLLRNISEQQSGKENSNGSPSAPPSSSYQSDQANDQENSRLVYTWIFTNYLINQ